MKLIEVTAWQAVFGWPVYAGWNLVADIKEQRGRADGDKSAVSAILIVMVTAAIWATAWLTVIWAILRMLGILPIQ